MKTIRNWLVKFCQQTTLHGWSYIVNEKGSFAKFLWIIAQIVFVSFASFLMTSNVIVYFNSTTKTSLESTTSSLDDLVFPGIFICNNNQVKASFLNQLTTYNKSWSSNFRDKVKKSFNRQFLHGNDEKDKELASLVTEALKEKFNWTEMIPIREISAPSCGKDMFLWVKTKGKSVKGYQYAYREPTDWGICCMISQHWITSGFNKTDGFTSDDFQSPLGVKKSTSAGVTILVDLESFDYSDKKAPSTGFDVVLGDTSDKPIPDINGLQIAPGTETLLRFGVTKTYVTDEAKQYLSPTKRNCYDSSEIHLMYHKPEDSYKYGMTHCLYDSKLQNIMKHCNCTPGFISSNEIKKWNTKKTCFRKDLGCTEDWMHAPDEEKSDTLEEVELIENGVLTTKRCLPSCDTDEIEVTTSFSTYPNYAMFLERPEVCIIMQKLVRICTDISYQAKKESFEKVYGLNGINGSICYDLYHAHKEDKVCNPKKSLKEEDKSKHEKLVRFLFKYAQENLAYIKVGMKNHFYTKVKRDLEITRLDFFNAVGGMLGLCLGLSIISVFELFFHFVKFLLCRNV